MSFWQNFSLPFELPVMDQLMNIAPPLHGSLPTKLAGVFSAAEVLPLEPNRPLTVLKALAFFQSFDVLSTFNDSITLLSKASMSVTTKA